MKSAAKDILGQLKEMQNPAVVEAMKRFAIPTENTFGISIPVFA